MARPICILTSSARCHSGLNVGQSNMMKSLISLVVLILLAAGVWTLLSTHEIPTDRSNSKIATPGSSSYGEPSTPSQNAPTRINWPIQDPPVITIQDIESLPSTVTVRDLVGRFGPGRPDMNALMFMSYRRGGGGEIVCTWYPTQEAPGETPPESSTENDILDWPVLAIFEYLPQIDIKPRYLFPTVLKGQQVSNW